MPAQVVQVVMPTLYLRLQPVNQSRSQLAIFLPVYRQIGSLIPGIMQ
ncbi:hypothetical protein PAQU9191_03919 [Photobacterium aquimaris]|uniref:Uncharacterized protein n=1 Tax=Photobacterium aquimaris TaxID=512643 RepID=A0A1Y6L285_9GAMM|nr:hypothetical protein PAQU9191_03919 [Photobacterium aquimaris]